MKEKHESAVHRALVGKHGKKEGHEESEKKGRTESVHYKRAHNGGFHAHVEKTNPDGSSSMEHHVLMSGDDAQEHMQEHMGDQPDAGEMPEEEQEAQETPAASAGAEQAPQAGM